MRSMSLLSCLLVGLSLSLSLGGCPAPADPDPDTENLPPNIAETITDVGAGLKKGIDCALGVGCKASDSDGTVVAAEADLSSLGGSASQALSQSSAGTWSWTGTVTPPTSGEVTYKIRVADDDGAIASREVTVSVGTVNQLPSVSNAAVTGTLKKSIAGTVTVSCKANDPDGTIASVKADLSGVGGSAAQALTKDDAGKWTWSGKVTPPSSGSVPVIFKAKDDAGAQGEGSASINVEATVAPSVTNAAITNPLRQDRPETVTVSCKASDSDGTVASVTANLSAIGGAASQALSKGDGDQWTWTGTLTPPGSGDLTVTFKATDDDGLTKTASAQVQVEPPQPPKVTVLKTEQFAPYVVRMDLRLRDGDDHAIGEGIDRDNFTILENGSIVDYTETNQFLTPGPNLPLKLMLVLDYTNSMKSAGAIDEMIVAAHDLVDSDYFTASHHIGVVEFHDREGLGMGYSRCIDLTRADEAGKADILATIPEEDDVEHGLSRVWDALDLALDTIISSGIEQNEMRTIVFLTDGNDTTSVRTPADLLWKAQSANIMLYPIGFGSVTAENLETLQTLANETQGRYFPAADAEELTEVFEQIVDDLRGQWNLTYITQKNSGYVDVEIRFTYQGATCSVAHWFDASSLAGEAGAIHKGILQVTDAEYDAEADTTRFLLKARYIPRNIDRFRFIMDPNTEFVVQGTGGLTEGWTVTRSGPVVELVGEEPLEYGAFGNIGFVTVPGEATSVKIGHDDSIYADLPQAKTMKLEGSAWGGRYELLVAWGNQNDGRCGIPANYNLTDIAAGGAHNLGLLTDGSIVAWGYNGYGQCSVPEPNKEFVAVAAGESHSLGLKEDGSIVGWGYNAYGQCNVPEPNSDFIGIAAGKHHSLGLKADGSVVAWGHNDYEQCNVALPNSGFAAVVAGEYHSLGIKTDGSVVAWGHNGNGQCNVPLPNSDFIALAAGEAHSLGIKADGSTVAWGDNSSQQCAVPEPNSDFVAIAAGKSHCLGLKADGSIVAWGYNGYNQCTVPTPNSGFTTISAGYYHSLGWRGN